MSRLRLEVVGGGTPPAELPGSGMLAIGSDPERAGLVVRGQGVAEVHCAIGRTKDGGYAIKDLGSEYGTLVNGARVTQARLQAGDEVLLGSMRLRVVDAAGGGPAPAAPATAEARSAPEAAPRAGRARAALPELPGYELQHPLGRGAMGDVYLAVQKSLDREVALKLLSKKHEQDAAFVRSFQAEARAAASLNHPNIVTVHDVGEHEGVHYLTMEYMDRGSLEVRVAKEGALPWPIVLGVLKDAASGLVYAESRGLVHRDIKPANLMQNHTGATKIADLGLATSISEEDAGEGGRKILGTPHFISPEQIRGEKADARSDLYSLGSTAYRLLTGRTPYQGASTREILRSKLREDPAPLGELAPDAPPGLVEVVERLMRREPAERYPSASALLRELERVEAGGGRTDAPQAAPAGGGARRLLVPGAVVAVLALGGWLLLGEGDTPPRPTPAPGPTEEPTAGGDPFALEDVTEPGPAPEDGPADDDVQEKLFETSAENALLRLDQRDLAPAERRDALRELAAEYLGTSAGTRASEEAERIDQELRESAAAASERESAVGGLMKALEAAAGLEADPIDPGASLRAIAAVPELGSFAGDDGVKAEVRRLEERVLARALTQFDAAQAELDALRAAGDFEGLRAGLLALLARCELPAFEAGEAPAGASEIAARAALWRATVEDLGDLETAFLAEQRRADRRAIGSRAGAGSGLLDDLTRLDFEAGAARTGALLEELGSPEARAWAEALDQDLRRAATALSVLWQNASSWRRMSVSDPQDRRGAPRDALGADAGGITLDDGGGARREVPWSAFGANTRALDVLFSKRLDRDYRPEEQEAIAALMHLSALAESLAGAAEMFRVGSGAVFTAREAEELPEAFGRALEWATGSERRAALERDREAARLLGRALQLGSEDAWTGAVALLERLFSEFGDTWLVRLLSDGTPVEVPGGPTAPDSPR